MLALPPIDAYAIHVENAHAAIVSTEHTAHVEHREHVAHELAVHLRHIQAVIEHHDAQVAAEQLAQAQQQQQALAPLPAMSPSPAAMPVLSEGPPPASGSYEQCVIAHESGGNYAAVNPVSGAGGAFQFLPSTWAGLGLPGLPQDASVAMQDQAFQTLYAQAGDSPWITDGCIG